MSNCKYELIFRAIRHARTLCPTLEDAECLGVSPLRPTMWCIEFVDFNGMAKEIHINPLELGQGEMQQ